MTPKLIIVLGETTAKLQQLTEEGEPLVGTGLDVELEIKKYVGAVMTAVDEDELPTVAWQNQALGIVEITEVENLSVGSYFVRYKLTNGDAEFDYVPNGEKADLWTVVAVANK